MLAQTHTHTHLHIQEKQMGKEKKYYVKEEIQLN